MNELSTRTTHIIAAEINSIKEQTRKMVLYNSIEIGRRLVEAKSMVSHGEWGDWLKNSVDYSQSTANNLMKIFDEYGANQLSLFGSDAKSQALGNLSYTQAVALLGVPEEQREQFIEENDIDTMSTRELQVVIKEKQRLEQELKESKEKEEKERQEKDKLNKSLEKLEIQSKDHALIVERLKNQIEEAKTDDDDEETAKLQDSLEKSKTDLETSLKRIKELEDDLKKKPIDIPATEIIEKVPEAIEAELLELRKKAAQLNNSKQAIKFSVCFESLVTGFKDLLGSLDEVKAVDPEQHDKYKGAVVGLIGKMSERL
jgi:myosin heavy subunit